MTVALLGPDGPESVRARYLWGCDGGRSTVRRALGLKLEGEPAQTWLIADAIVDTDVDRDGVHWLTAGDSALMLFPFPDPHRWRLLDMTGEGDPEDPSAIARQFTAKLTRALGRDTVVEPPTWVSRFTIQQRAVPAMHVGRVFISGDAAHVHSPASGQGMNTGIQDAINLAWKLAMVVRGTAAPGLLDTYDAERVPIGQALLASTGEVTANTTVDTGARASGASEQGFADALIQRMSGLRIAYPDSPLSDEDGASSTPRSGERLTQITAADAQSGGWITLRSRLRAPAWHLLRFTDDERRTARDAVDDAAGGTPDWIDPVLIGEHRAVGDGVRDADGRVAATLSARAGDWILVRPDGYVSGRGSTPQTLHEHLDRLAAAGVGARRASTSAARADGTAEEER